MKPDGFGASSPGEIIAIPGNDYAFLPEPLPPAELPLESVMVEMGEAMQSIGRLQGRGKDLPNPDLLIRPLRESEALASSRMEGTIAEPRDLAKAAAQTNPRKVDAGDDIREILNYGTALRDAMSSLSDMPITHSMIRGVHERLLSGLSAARGANKFPGEYRNDQRHISYDKIIRFTPPPAPEAKSALDELVDYIRAPALGMPPLIDAALIHYQFEAIHPFRDGNGRVGRILIPVFLAANGVLEKELPLFYPSVVLEKHRQEYLDRLLAVSRDGDWLGWIRFFLEVTQETCAETLERIERIFALLEEYKGQLAGKSRSQNPIILVEHLFQEPVVTIADAAKLCQVTYHSARDLVAHLMEVGILEEFPGERPRLFFAPGIIDLYQP